MKLSISLVTITLSLFIVTAGAAQEPPEGTSRFITTVQPEIYVDDEWGNQAWVREYDSKYDFLDIGELDSRGYLAQYQYIFDGSDLLSDQRQVDFSGGIGYNFSGRVQFNQLIHRLDWIQSPEPGLQPPSSQTTFSSIISPDWTELDRSQVDINLGYRTRWFQDFRFVGEYWADSEDGLRQMFWFRRTGGFPLSFSKWSTGRPIDRNTTEPGIGFDSQLNRNTALSYRFYDTSFDGTKTGPILTGVDPSEPIAQMTEPDTDTTTNEVRLNSNLKDNLSLTGFFTRRDRKHRTNGVNAVEFTTPFTFTPIDQDVEADITSGNIGLNYLPSQDWYVTFKHYRSNYDLDSPDIIDQVAGGLLNQAVSWRDVRTSIDANYTGIRRWTLYGGYERREIKRNGRDPHGDHEEFSHALFFDDSDHNIFKIGFTGRPTNNLTFRLWNRFDSVDVPGYRGAGSDIWDLSASVLYVPRFDTVLNIGFSRRDEDNDELDTLPPVPPVTAPDYEEIREFIAGAGYDSTITSFMISGWKALNSRLSLDLSYGRDDIDNDSLWVLGLDPAFLPHLAPFVTPFDAHSNVYTVGLTYNLGNRWRLRGDFSYTDSFGKSRPDIFQLTRPGEGEVDWRPISRKDTRWSASVGYLLNPVTQIDIEFTAFRWKDNVDPRNNGNFDVITLAGVRRF